MGLFGVLIETLWNVKKILSPDWFSVKNGINRNIMECKVRYKGNQLCTEICINRNIMECKDRPPDSAQAFDVGINRNIMECKER